MDDAESVMQASLAMADAIGRRDVKLVASLLAPGFVHRTPGGDAQDAETFTAAIARIPGEIAFVKLGNIEIDFADGGALVTGTQHARIRVEGQDIDDHRAFVDWLVKHDGRWKFRVAVDFPALQDQHAGDER